MEEEIKRQVLQVRSEAAQKIEKVRLQNEGRMRMLKQKILETRSQVARMILTEHEQVCF